jgi:hypothetical protein
VSPVHPERSRGAAQLDLRHSDAALGTFSRRFFDDGLGPELSTAAFAKFDASKLDARTVGWALGAWQARTLDEYRSQVGFTEFLMELTELGSSFDVLSTAVRVVRDETRHVELCKRMVIALGGDAVIPGEPDWVRSQPKVPLLERVLRSTIGSLCIGETLSMALLAATRKVTREPLARATLTVLAADESVHSQFGWRLLAQLWPAAGKKLQRKLIGELIYLFASAHHVVFEGDDAGPRQRNPFGDLLGAERRATYVKSLEKDVLRRFDALKIPARAEAKRAGVV